MIPVLLSCVCGIDVDGNGGRGGDVILKCSTTILDFRFFALSSRYLSFTALRPKLTNLKFKDLWITVVDIPELIKEAQQNRGLGHAFLRHVERTN